ncbi:MAG: ATPase domain-containing protein [Candidatus Nezhaarchaeales archaeon]
MVLVSANRVKTGVPGLDEVMEGGLLRGYTYVVMGGPGSGKTTLGVQFIYKGIVDYGENGVYVTLEEPPESIRANVLRFRWELLGLEERGKLVIVDGSPIKRVPGHYVMQAPQVGTVDFTMESLASVIHAARRKVGAERIVIDPLNALTLLYGSDQYVLRRELLELIRTLNEAGCTTLLMSEVREREGRRMRYGVETFLAQGVIILHTIRVKGAKIKALEILKMRGTKHEEQLLPYKITDRGIMVFPGEKVFV